MARPKENQPVEGILEQGLEIPDGVLFDVKTSDKKGEAKISKIKPNKIRHRHNLTIAHGFFYHGNYFENGRQKPNTNKLNKSH